MKRIAIGIVILVLVLGVPSVYLHDWPWAWGPALAQQAVLRLGLTAGSGTAGQLVASGTIEAHTIAVSSSTAGRLAEMRLNEGDQVSAGDLIARLDTTIDDAQIGQAEAVAAQAEAQAALLRSGARPADVETARAAVGQAEAARAAAFTAWQDAKTLIDAPASLDVKIAGAQAALQAAEAQLRAAQAGATAADLDQALWQRIVESLKAGFDVPLPYPGNPIVHVNAGPDKINGAALQWNLASQKTWQAHAQLGTATTARANARQALADLAAQKADPQNLRAQANAAEAAYRVAEATVATAKANLGVVLAGAPEEQIKTAEAQARAAREGIRPIQVRRDQARITAPISGTVTEVVLRRGEVAVPGSPIVRLADLREVKLTVYVPEPQLGQAHVGQAVQIAVDSFPGRVFPGRVTLVANEAEFTPKNVQTRQQRANTVYAVEIALPNPDGALKPGMPADAYFGGIEPGDIATAGQDVSRLSGPIQASGTVEGTETDISAELGGRVAEVAAGEGDQAPAGKILITLDAGQLEAQYNQAQSTLAAARANLALVTAAPQAARVALAQAQVEQAQSVLTAARSALTDAQTLRAHPQDLESQITAAHGQLDAATAQMDLARANLKAAQVLQESKPEATGSDQDRTQRAVYDQQVLAAGAALDAAAAQQAGAQASLNALYAIRQRPVALDAAVHKAEGQVLLASAGITTALASLAQAQAPSQQEAMTLARAQVDQAAAAASLLQATIDKMKIASPVTGTVTAQMIHPGEVAQPGTALLTLVNLSQVKLVIYVSESRIGEIRLGQEADVTADAYPGRRFKGTVTHINDQAEFTPKNVQTQEERVKMVFAVEIALDNEDGALKPGMPADASLR